MRSISKKTLNSLFAKSGNICAFPGCNNEIFNSQSTQVGEVAHIEAEAVGGSRYNENQTEEERNGYDNLICLCRRHHKEVDSNVKRYTVERLKDMKYNHENKFESINCQFDYSKIYEAKLNLEEYYKTVSTENTKNESELKVDMEKFKTFQKLVKEINKSIDYVERTSNEFLQYSEGKLNDEIINYIKKLNYDTTKWENVYYSENPFINTYWEVLAIGYSNCIIQERVNLLNMEILYYSEYLKFNNDARIATRLRKAKKELLKLAGNLNYVD